MRNFLRNLKISTKIFCLLVLTILSMTVVIGLGLKHIRAIGKEVTATIGEDIPLLEAAREITYHSLEQSNHLERAMQFGKRMAKDKAAKDNFEVERKNFLKHGRMITQKIEGNRALIDLMCEKYKMGEISDILLSVDYELRSMDKDHADYQFLSERVFNLLSRGKLAEAEPTIQKVTKKSKVEEDFTQLTSLNSFLLAVGKFIEYSTVEAKRNEQSARLGMISFSAFILFLSTAFGIFISRSISKPLGAAVNIADQIAAGDRNVEIKAISKDETGKLLAAMGKMSCAIGKSEENLKATNQQLRVNEQQLRATNQQLQASEQQLRATNQQLQASEQQLRATNQQLQAEVAERKKVEQMLAQKRNLLHAAVDTLHDEIFTKDTSGTFVFSNFACSHNLGAESPKAVVGKTDFDFFPKKDAERDYAIEQEIMRTGQSLINGEVPIYDEAGKITKWASSSKFPWRDSSGNIVGIVGISRDITERKRAEQAVRETNHELKEMQSQLVQNEKLASIGQLAAGVAHEMNTPVGFVASNFQTLEDYIKKIRGLLEMHAELVGGIKTAQKTELLKKVDAISKSRDDMKMDFILEDIQGLFDDSREGLDRVTNIVQNLRDFSRSDLPGSLDEYNINDGIKTTLAVATNEIKYDAKVKTDFSEVPSILCHAGQVNQVLLNIFINAAQAIKSRHGDDMGAITIKTYATDDQVVCEIADSGCGIAPENLSKVFDPFFTTKPAGKGTGLGLSVSYDIIVHKHNGKLLVDSTVGKGTKFTIKLPFGRENPNEREEIVNNGKKNSVICRR